MYFVNFVITAKQYADCRRRKVKPVLISNALLSDGTRQRPCFLGYLLVFRDFINKFPRLVRYRAFDVIFMY